LAEVFTSTFSKENFLPKFMDDRTTRKLGEILGGSFFE